MPLIFTISRNELAYCNEDGSIRHGCGSGEGSLKACTSKVSTNLVLSLFPGIDLFGRGFEAEGYCVVRGPDMIFGGDIREFHPTRGKFDGIIGGPPCQDFSRARRTAPTGYGLEMLSEFCRCVTEAAPEWFLMENVPCVPSLVIHGYHIQRLDLNANECGSAQSRLRHFQFGSRSGKVIAPQRRKPGAESRPTLLTRRKCGDRSVTFGSFCELQGLPRSFSLPDFTKLGKFRAVGNGVHVAVARTLAVAVRNALDQFFASALCSCGCGRLLQGKEKCATAACRKRLQRQREDQA
jgi:DNA (cytosine-5)-methyltransferase 1